MSGISLKNLRLLDLGGREVVLKDVCREISLLIFLRHLA